METNKQNKIWEGLKNIVFGIILGISNVIPGVSAGTMAVVLGIYDRILDACSIKRLVKNLFFLITLIIGVAVGILLFSKAIEFLVQYYPVHTNFFFLGLILGSIPLIYREGVKTSGFKARYLIPCIVALAFMIVIYILGQNGEASADFTTMNVGNFFLLMGAGLISAVAMIVPGVSGSMIMVIIGTYSTVISAVSHLNFTILLPVAIGIVIGLIVGIKGVKIFLKKFPSATYFAILGLILGSILSLVEGFVLDWSGVLSLVIMLLGACIAYLFSRPKKENGEVAPQE